MISDSLVLSEEQKIELLRMGQSRSLPAGYVFRARLILILAEGASYSSIKQQLRTSAPTISRWKQRFRVAGWMGWTGLIPDRSRPRSLPGWRARILAADGSTHWSCRKLAAVLGVSKDVVHRVWQEAGLKSHRLERGLSRSPTRIAEREERIRHPLLECQPKSWRSPTHGIV